MKPLDAAGRARIRRLIADFRQGRGPLVFHEKVGLARDLEALLNEVEKRP